MKKFLYTIIFILATQFVFSQTADKTTGCIPLKVNFSSPSAAEYFWVFDDGTTSDKQNPEHIFTSDGNYTVKLFSNSSQSQEIGKLSITVYPDLIVDLKSDEGGNSDEKSPAYTYDDMGTYDISLALKTNYAECDITIIEEDYITIEEKEADFKLDKNSSCTAPATFTISNLSENLEGYTYEWDFGDGRTSTDFAPDAITYNEVGLYIVELVMTAPGGCYDRRQSSIRVGPPIIKILMEDTLCLESTITVWNESTGVSHFWDFGEGAEPRESREGFPSVTYTTPGVKTVYYRNRQGVCEGDTTFTVYVPEKISSFQVSPQTICGSPSVTLELEADIKNMDNYYWNESDSSTYK